MVLSTGQYLVVTQVSSTNTTAVITIQFSADPDTYSYPSLAQELATLAGIPASSIILVSDQVSDASKRGDFVYSQAHVLTLDIVSSSPSRPASSIVQALTQQVMTNSAIFESMGISLTQASFVAACDTSGACTCAEPYYIPPTCQILALCTNNCTENGICVNGATSRVCQCNAGYTGADCSAQTCVNDCSNHGSCLIQAGAAGICQCETGWTGEICNITAPCPNNCSESGTCVLGVCRCFTGRTGSDCSSASAAELANTNPSEKGLSSQDILAIVISIVGAFVLAAIILIIYLFVQHRKRFGVL